jgi:hypothetical protein
MSLTEHKDESVTLSAERQLVCLESAWELEALACLLPSVSTNGTPEETRIVYQVRLIASRIKELSEILTAGLSDSISTTDDLERQLKMTN